MPASPARSNGRCNNCGTRIILIANPRVVNKCFQCGSTDVGPRYCDWCEQPIKLGEMHSWGRRIQWEAHERCILEHGEQAPITRSKLNLTKTEEKPIEKPELQDIDIEEFSIDEITESEFIELDEAQTKQVEEPKRPEVKPTPKPKRCMTFYDSVYLLISARIHYYIYGPAGCGKSHIVEQAAKHFNMMFRSISLNVQTMPSALLGYMDAHGTYRGTDFRTVYENGGVFLIDEMDNASGNLLTCLNSAIANKFLQFPDGMVYMHDDCIIVSTGNTTGRGKTAQYISRQTLDAATLDRFAYLAHDYDEALEIALAIGKNHFEQRTTGNVEYFPCEDEGKRVAWAKSVQRIRANARKHGLQTVVSMRPVVTGCKLLNHYTVQELAEMLISKGTDADTRTKLLEGAF